MERVLNLSERRRARELARECWIDSMQSQDSAEALFRERAAIRYQIDPATILLFLQIAMLLWKWWSERKISEPSTVAFGDEPIDWSEDED